MPALRSVLSDKSEDVYIADKPVVINVENVSMDYNFANEKLNSLKEYFIALLKRQLMFKRFRALDNISFKVQKGDVYGILGTNGSGKSTLLKIVSGVLEPTEGSVEIHGKVAPLIEMGAGFDFELTGRENVYLNGSLLGYSRRFIDQHFDEIVEFAEIGKFIDLPIKNYSSGMVSRIAFAIATIMVPEILIVDEVLSVGDQMFRKKCEKRIQELIRDHGTTVLIVSHSSDEIDRMCNKAIWIEKGHMRMIGEAREVSLAYQALGGHAGSEESEGYIFEMLKKAPRKEPNFISYISGHEDVLICDIVNNYILNYDKSLDTVVVIDKEDPRLYQIGMAFASQYGGALVLLDGGEIDSNAASFLVAARPKHVYLLGDELSDFSVKNDLNAFCRDPEIVEFRNGDISQLSFDLLEYCEATQGKADAVLLILGDIGSAAVALCPYAYENRIPAVWAAPSIDSYSSAIGRLEAMHFKKVICLCPKEMMESAQAVADADAGEIDVMFFLDERTTKSGEYAIDWIRTQGVNSKTIFFAPLDEPGSGILASSLAAKNKALLVPVDHTDMDDMRMASELVTGLADDIDYIRLVGSPGSFDNVDIDILSRAAAKD